MRFSGLFALSFLAACATALPQEPLLDAQPQRRELTKRQIFLRDDLGLTDADFARPAPLLRRTNGRRMDAMRELRASAADTPEWRVSQSAHYFFVVTGRDDGFDRRLVEQSEAARAAVRELFPHPELDPVPIHTGPHLVRCAKDREQFHSYGGPGGSRGYWSPIAREMVLHRERADGDTTTWQGLRGLVFLAYASELWGTCELPVWFTRGHSEFFAGFVDSGAAPARIELVPAPNSAMVGQWRSIERNRALVPVNELLAGKPVDSMGLVELQVSAWALVWHLRALEREAPEHPHATLLRRWFAEWLVDGDARRATDVAFAGVDLVALDLAVRERIRALHEPTRR